ncbi:MAG: glutamine-hydrolyzing carbamoyl-phosphate synthase small subunit [Chlorobi bacterium]|nr:glutamine-hydrolyzing carbamoyl-phosphate synthase small subunit [Chlorobiota bacterium]
MTHSAILVLENGAVFRGTSFGSKGEITGEVVFNTSMTGYQEILTDPSYAGQIVTMTSPMIGNYGVNKEDVESSRPRIRALVVKEYSTRFSNWRAETSLHEYLQEYDIPGITDIDTRQLTRMIREIGAMRGILSTETDDVNALLERVKASPVMSGLDLASEVTTKEAYKWESAQTSNGFDVPVSSTEPAFNVVVVDFGVKYNILRRLRAHGMKLHVVPASASADEILALEPDGIFLSNGPGDPAAVTYAIDTIRRLVGKKPIFGICLGHQLLALALGAKTYKLKFGHRGANHPVKNLRTAVVEITSQNHGFAVDADSLPADLELTHVNLNDSTVEGFRHRSEPVFCVQYHPEASPGPHDSDYLFRQFREIMTGEFTT